VDHKKLAEARIHAMTTADLNRFMVVACALVSDLYCPGYSSAEALVEGIEPHPNCGPLQSRCLEDHSQGHCGAVGQEKRWQGTIP